jgi:putative YhbY family RNA-binding protein
MIELTSQRRRELRAQAHVLHPVVAVGQHGLTPHVMHEIDVALRAHGLIKVRVFSDDRGQRDTMLARIADELDAAPVQHLGKLLILWRPPEAVEKRVEPAKRPAKKPGKARGSRAVKRPSMDRNAREPRELDTVGRRMRGPASSEDARTEPGSRRRRSATTKRLPRGGDDAQAPGLRRRRHAAAIADAPSGKRSPRESLLGARKVKPAPEALRRKSSRPASARPPTGKSAPSPRRRRRVG